MGAGFAAPAASHVPNVAVARTGGTLERGGEELRGALLTVVSASLGSISASVSCQIGSQVGWGLKSGLVQQFGRISGYSRNACFMHGNCSFGGFSPAPTPLVGAVFAEGARAKRSPSPRSVR